MKPELARLLTTSLAQFLDANGKARMCLSNSECMALEKAFTKEKFDDIEAFACRKMTGQEKPQLTEFEKAVENVLCGVGVPGDDIFGYDNIHGTAQALLEIAKKELVHEMPMPEDSVLFNKGVQEGRRLAMSSMPKWRKWGNGVCGNSEGIPVAIVKTGYGYKLASSLGIGGEEYIMLSDLEELPKEGDK